jgi:hypothetical protein
MSSTLERTGGRRARAPAAAQKTLEAKIEQIRRLKSGESDMYTYLHQLLTNSAYGLGLKGDQIITDSIIVPGTRSRPDIPILEILNGRSSLTTRAHLRRVEAKKDKKISKSVDSVYDEKSSYILPGTRHFYLLDPAAPGY